VEGDDVERSNKEEEGAEELPVSILASVRSQRTENLPVQWELSLDCLGLE